MKSRTRWIIAVVILITIYSFGVDIVHSNQSRERLAAIKVSCQINPQTFMATVNQWRSVTGAPALAYSSSLESGAKARLADMMQGQYYGHVNPATKEQSYTTVMKYDTAATSESEVLDSPIDPSLTMSDFKNSPEHYNALINPAYHYFGAVAVYQPESWAVYDNSGNLQAKAGVYRGNCIIIGEVADKDTSSASQAANSSPVATKIPTVTPVIYPKVSTYTYTPPPVYTPQVPTCDQASLANIKANRDSLAAQFTATHQANLAILNANYPSGYANSADYQVATLAENSHFSQQSTDLQNSYAAAVKQINC